MSNLLQKIKFEIISDDEKLVLSKINDLLIEYFPDKKVEPVFGSDVVTFVVLGE